MKFDFHPTAGRPSLEGEEWRVVNGTADAYHVSTLGRIWSVPRTIPAIGKQFGKWRHLKGRLKRAYRLKDGALWVGLKYDDGVVRHRRLAAVIYETFVGHVPDGFVVDHHDEDRTNFSPENLYVRSKMPGEQDRYVSPKHSSHPGARRYIR